MTTVVVVGAEGDEGGEFLFAPDAATGVVGGAEEKGLDDQATRACFYERPLKVRDRKGKMAVFPQSQ